MQPQALFQKALARAQALEGHPAAEAASLEALRDDAVQFFRRVPEPPLYRRSQDPARARAEGLIGEATELLARSWALIRGGAAPAADTFLAQALEAHAEALCHSADGRISEAESAWRKALRLERSFRDARRVWVRAEEVERPVFDRATRSSRFDPRDDPSLHVRLTCPASECQHPHDYAFSPSYATQLFTCPKCRAAFLTYFCELQDVTIEQTPRGRRYLFRVEELGGAQARIEFEDSSGKALQAGPGDLVAFLYTPKRELRGLIDLTTSRILWVRSPSSCFVATAAFGPGAPELEVFRRFRDRALLTRAEGRAFVRVYYACGPALARGVLSHSALQRITRALLRALHRLLLRTGFGPDPL